MVGRGTPLASGLIVVGGMFASRVLPVTTALFLFTTTMTSVTGFLFPIQGFTPALGVGILACVILLFALFALYKEHVAGVWRPIYVITAVASLYLIAIFKCLRSSRAELRAFRRNQTVEVQAVAGNRVYRSVRGRK